MTSVFICTLQANQLYSSSRLPLQTHDPYPVRAFSDHMGLKNETQIQRANSPGHINVQVVGCQVDHQSNPSDHNIISPCYRQYCLFYSPLI